MRPCLPLQSLVYFTSKIAPIAQLDRASDFESEGWGFDSLWVHDNADYQILLPQKCHLVVAHALIA